MGAVLWIAGGALLPVAGGSLILSIVLAGLAGIAGLVYLALLELLGVRDGRQVFGIVRDRLGRPRPD